MGCQCSELIDSGSGANVAHYEYGPFGEVTASTGDLAVGNPFRFSTKYWDDETGLGYWGYRYYDPITGRWLSRDPIGERGGENIYGFIQNDPVDVIDNLGLIPVWLEQTAKEVGFQAFRALAVTASQWRDVMDAWYYETGPHPVTYTGISDSRNSDIASNPGFRKLLTCWIAQKRGESVPSGAWKVDKTGIQWIYTYSRYNAAGGFEAYRSETEFLGTYAANVTALGSSSGGKCRYKIHAWNTSGWTSGTRLPGFVADALRSLGWSGTSIFYNHRRGAGPYTPSRGGNLDQNYDFETEADCCAKCVLP